MNVSILALFFQIAASGATPAVGGQADLAGLPTGEVRLSGVVAPGVERPRLIAARIGPSDRRVPLDWEVPETGHGLVDGVSWSSYRLPAGRYAVAIDRGPLASVLTAEVEVIAGKDASATANGVESRALWVRARDALKAPVPGVRLVPSGVGPSERALALMLSRRAGIAKSDGVLDFGLVPAATPLTLQLTAPGYRTAALKLGALFEGGVRDLTLAPNQDVEVRVAGLAGRRGEAKPEVSLTRCLMQRAQSNCSPQVEGRRQLLDGEGRAHFKRVEGGYAQVELRVPGVGTTHETINVASDGDTPALVVALNVGEWVLRGTTRVHAGSELSARIKAMEIVNGIGEGTAAETTSSADGSFELKVVSSAGHRMGLSAESDDPRAITTTPNTVVLADGVTVVEGVDLELDATGLEIVVRDSRTQEPLPGCDVAITWEKSDTAASRGSIKKTDASGVHREIGLAEGVVRVRVGCKDHYPSDLGSVDLVRNETRHVDVSVESSQDLVVAVDDESGAPVAGVTAFAVNSPFSVAGGARMTGTVAAVGVTDAGGEIRLKGESYGGRTMFLVVSARALAITTLPMPSSCTQPDDCRVDVTARAPSTVAGVKIRNESGEPISRSALTVSRSGVPIPDRVLAAVLSANGLADDAPAMPLDLGVAAFLSDGVYAVATQHYVPEPATKKGVWKSSVIGSFSVPSLERVELLDRDGASAKPAHVEVPHVAER